MRVDTKLRALILVVVFLVSCTTPTAPDPEPVCHVATNPTCEDLDEWGYPNPVPRG